MSDSAIRLDKWLWFARFTKSRAEAQKLIERGQITLDGKIVGKVSTTAKIGAALVIVTGPVKHSVAVLALGTRRGPVAEAQGLYTRTAPRERLTWEDAALPLRRRAP